MRWMVIALVFGLSTSVQADDIDISVSAIINGNQFATRRTAFEVEGPENAVRVEMYELNIRHALGVPEIPNDFEQKLPAHLKKLIGQRIRVTGNLDPIRSVNGQYSSILTIHGNLQFASQRPHADQIIGIDPRKGVKLPETGKRDLVGNLKVQRVEWQGLLRSIFVLEDAIIPELERQDGVRVLPNPRDGVLSDYFRGTGFLVIATPVENSSPFRSKSGLMQQKYQIRKLLSNPSEYLKVDQVVEAPFRSHLKSEQLVILGTDRSELEFQQKSGRPPTWMEPADISESHANYLAGLSSGQTDFVQRTAHLIDSLDTQDPRILADVHEHLKKTPGKQIEQVKDRLDREKLRSWLADPIAKARPHLYLRLLGHCGNAEDAAFLKARIAGKWKEGYFANELVGYLILVGDEGLPFVEQAAAAKYFPWCPAGIDSLEAAWGVNDKLTRQAVLKVVPQFLDKDPDIAAKAIRMQAVLGDWSQTRKLIERYHTEKKIKDGAFENPTVIHRAIVDFAVLAEASRKEGQDASLSSIEARNFLQKLSAENQQLRAEYEEKKARVAKGQWPWEY